MVKKLLIVLSVFAVATTVLGQVREKGKFVVELLGFFSPIEPAPLSGNHDMTVVEVFPPYGAVWLYMQPHQSENFKTYTHKNCPIGINVDKQGRLIGFNLPAQPYGMDFSLPRPVEMNVLRAYEIRISGTSAYHRTHFLIRKDHKGRGLCFANALGVGKQNNQNRVG